MNKYEHGFSLVEVLLASTLLGMFFTILVGFFFYGQESAVISGERNRAINLADEGLEAVRNIRDNQFTNLPDGTYGLGIVGNNWTLTASPTAIEGFTRAVRISTLDAQTKIATASVTWSQQLHRTGSVSLTTRFTNWMTSVNTWTGASLESSFNLSLLNSGSETGNILSIFTQGNYAYVGRTNTGIGTEFYILDISNPASPVLVGQRDLNTNPNDIVVVGNYAYIASDDNSSELQIVDVSTPSTIANAGKLTTVDLTSANSNSINADAVGLATDGTYLYMARVTGDKLIIFNLSTPAAPTIVGRLTTIVGNAIDIALSGSTAYVITDDDTQELQTVDVTTKTAPVKLGSLNLNSGNEAANPLSVAAYGSTVYIGRAVSAAPELYKISTVTPASPTLASTIEMNSSAYAIALSETGTFGFVATNDTAADIKIVDTTTFSSILRTVNTADTLADVGYSSTKTRVVVGGSNDASEIQIIKP